MFHYGNEGAEKNEYEGHFQRVKRNHWGRFVDQKNVLVYSQCIWGWAGGGGAVWFKSKETYWRVWVNL